MKRHLIWIAGIALAMVLTGCSTTGKLEGEGAGGTPEQGATGAPPPPSEGNQGGAQASGAQGGGAVQGDELQNPNSPLAQRVIYFDFDSSEIKSQYMDLLKAHGEYLATHPKVKVEVEGHTDERGSREYNLALGERRANAVAKVLELNGAAGDQVQTVSYGEEKPADPGHNEAAWAKNRRAELVYQR